MTPELAAYVVKNYVLPMFEHDPQQKKARKPSASQKRSRIPSLAQGTIHEDLKLTSTLFDEVNELRSYQQGMKEAIQEARYERDLLKKQLRKLTLENRHLRQTIATQQAQLLKEEKLKHSQNQINDQMHRWIEDLSELTLMSEQMRRRVEIEYRT